MSLIKNKNTTNNGADEAARNALKDSLYEAFLALRTPEECRNFLIDLCTPKEIEDFAERLAIAKLLDQGDVSYREISARTGASTTTIGRVARFLQQEQNRGYRLVLDRLRNTDESGAGS